MTTASLKTIKSKTATKKTSSAKKSVSKPTKASGGTSKLDNVKETIYRTLCENHTMGITETSKLDLAMEAGYGNTRSETFAKAIKSLMNDDGTVTQGSKKDGFVLSDRGIEGMPQDLKVPSSSSSSSEEKKKEKLEKIHARHVEFIEKKVKSGVDKVRILWDILVDRKEHTLADLSSALGYGNPRSFGNTKIVAVMKEMGLVEPAGKGAIRMTDKAFP